MKKTVLILLGLVMILCALESLADKYQSGELKPEDAAKPHGRNSEKARYYRQSDTSRTFCGVTPNFEVLDPIVESGKPLTVRLRLKNSSDSQTEFRYLNTSFIQHIRVYDAQNQRVPFRVNAPFTESGAARITLRAGERATTIVSIDLWRYYDLRPGKYFLEFTYDLRLVSDPTVAARYMKRYQTDDLVLWDTKKYPFIVGDHDVGAGQNHSLSTETPEAQPEHILAVSSNATEVLSPRDAAIMQLLSDGPGPVQRNIAALPPCVVPSLRHWYEKPFVFIEQGQDFPKLRDIRRAGDGQFRLLFFSELKDDNSVLCFEDHTSLGVTHRAVILRRTGSTCSVVMDFAFDLPLNSLEQLQVAINTQRNGR